MTAATMELSDRVRRFDASIGSDLEGDGVLSQTNHEILRGLLEEAGYGCVYSREKEKTGVYPMNERNIYDRLGVGHIDVFVEENLGNLENNGFSHLRLGVGGYRKFVENYKKITTRGDKYNIWGIWGMMITILGVSEMRAHPALGLSMTLFGAGNTILAMYSDVRRKKKARERIISLNPETNPRIAIQKALELRTKSVQT